MNTKKYAKYSKKQFLWPTIYHLYFNTIEFLLIWNHKSNTRNYLDQTIIWDAKSHLGRKEAGKNEKKYVM